MNNYIDAQCRQMIAMVNSFTNACHLAARKDNGKVSKDEEKNLKRIVKATERFKKNLQKVLIE